MEFEGGKYIYEVTSVLPIQNFIWVSDVISIYFGLNFVLIFVTSAG